MEFSKIFPYSIYSSMTIPVYIYICDLYKCDGWYLDTYENGGIFKTKETLQILLIFGAIQYLRYLKK